MVGTTRPVSNCEEAGRKAGELAQLDEAHGPFKPHRADALADHLFVDLLLDARGINGDGRQFFRFGVEYRKDIVRQIQR